MGQSVFLSISKINITAQQCDGKGRDPSQHEDPSYLINLYSFWSFAIVWSYSFSYDESTRFTRLKWKRVLYLKGRVTHLTNHDICFGVKMNVWITYGQWHIYNVLLVAVWVRCSVQVSTCWLEHPQSMTITDTQSELFCFKVTQL